jgi:hypothetical protein
MGFKGIIGIIACASLAVAGCGPTPPNSAGSSPPATSTADVVAQVAATQSKVAGAIDVVRSAASSSAATTVIRDAWETFDVALSGIDVLVQTGRLKKNSPAALRVRAAVATTKHALQAASAAQRAGSATDAMTALREAQTALAQIRAAL